MKNALLYTLAVGLFIVLSVYNLNAQDYLMDGTSITDCGGFFKDSGGEGAYDANENFTTTICSDQSLGTHIRLDFTGINIGDGDSFKAYDAASEDPIYQLNPIWEGHPNAPFTLAATVANPSGCLTIVFNSDFLNEENAGWIAKISCIPSCQTILAQLVSATPAVMPQDTGWIDICPGETVSFSGSSEYLQDGYSYFQHDSLSVFEWTFGNGYSDKGLQVTNVYEKPGIYLAQLKITDHLGCESTNHISQRLRVSSYPAYSYDIDPTSCLGDTISINSSINPLVASDVNAFSEPISTAKTLLFIEPLFLPDGTGAMYETSLFFTQFLSGQTLNDPNDILNVSLTMEHSYSGDLDIELICPNGSSVDILKFNSGPSPGSTNFGEPFASAPVDGESADTTLGVPYTYFFAANTANGTLDQFALNAPTYVYTTLPSEETGLTFTYGDRYFPSGTYKPEGSFSSLVGCPLNGEWTIRVRDNLGLDNGWLTEWSMTFEDDLYTNIETFLPTVIEGGWESAPNVITANQDALMAVPVEAGEVSYTFWTKNDFGCRSDTTLTYNILSPDHPDCMISAATTLIETDFMIAPNPVVSSLRLEMPAKIASFSQIEIFNALGEIVIVEPIVNGKLIYTINMSSLPVGVYYLRLRGNELVSSLKKVIKL